MREFKRIAVAQLREPTHAARVEIDDVQLDSLCQSIRDVGLIEPLIVKPVGDGSYEVTAGHRRLLALRRVGLEKADCIVDARDNLADAVKTAENLEREELNPVDEGQFYTELFEQLGQDVDKVAERVKRSRTYVEGRMLLLRGWACVREALSRRQISVGVAESFNRMVREEDAEYYMQFARNGGVSVRTARQWTAEANLRAELQAKGQETPPTHPADVPVATPYDAGAARVFAGAMPYELSSSQEPRPCLYCREVSEEYRMLRKFVCVPCAQLYQLPSALTPERPAALPPRGGER